MSQKNRLWGRPAASCNLHHMDDVFLVVYGDTLFSVDSIVSFKISSELSADLTLFLHPNDHPYDSDLVETESDGRVTASSQIAPR